MKNKNFIVVFVDDMGFGDVASYGHPTIKTPNLDIMAFEGKNGHSFIQPPVSVRQVEQHY